MSTATDDGRRATEVPVLVVGGGPAGLAAAISVARHGVECLLVERRSQGSAPPRATAISTRSMELLRSWGLEEEILAGAVEVEWLQWFCETLAEADSGHSSVTGLPTRAQAAMVSPSAPACVPQDHLEPVLMDHLRSLPAGSVETGCEVVGVEDRGEGVRVALRDVDSGESRQIEARYLVGADGAHSAVRRALRIEMHGEDRLLEAVSALFRAPLWELLGERRYGLYATARPAADGVFLPAGRDDRWLYAVMREPGASMDDLAEEPIAARIRAGAGVPDLDLRVERIGGFSFAAKLAERFRSGSAFLVGDAAHRVTPRGGTGMNVAIHDGYDLGWKLAWVLQGWESPTLLDSYEAERRPVAEHNLNRSADPAGTARDAGSELQVDLGGRIKHAWIHDRPGVSTLDLLGPGTTVLTGPEGPAEGVAAAGRGRAPIEFQRLDAITARAMGLGPGGALPARPDGVPGPYFPPQL